MSTYADRFREIDDSEGVCNPMKLKLAEEDRQDLREEMRDRGFSEDQISDAENGKPL